MTMIQRHFHTKDDILYPFIVKLEGRALHCNTNTNSYYSHLTQSIISQQLSTKVADVIIARFQSIVGAEHPTPKQVLAVSDEALRAGGLSWAKISYAKDLAAKVAKGELPLHQLPEMEDEAVITEFTKVKGIGRWTAEMFLIFTLGREDIFSTGDLGLKTAIKNLYGLPYDNTKKYLAEVIELSQKWKPYRSYASLALWKSLEKAAV